MANKATFDADVQFIAAAAQAEGAPMGPRKFSIEAYTGAAIRQAWSAEPLVIDLEGMKIRQSLPIVLAHDYALGSILGQTTSVRAENGRLYVEGEILSDSEAANNIVAMADKGFRWQASIGADVGRHQKINADQSVSVNGQTFHGPVRIVRASTLREVSFVTLGADDATSVHIAAEEENTMADNANETPDVVNAASDAPAVAAVEPTPAIAAAAVATSNAADFVALNERFTKLEKLMTTRDSRAPAIHIAERVGGEQAVEAALCLQGGLPNAHKAFDDKTLAAGEKMRRTVSISEVFVEAARANGYTGSNRISTGNLPTIIAAAFATHQISDLLSAVANKFLLAGFNAVEDSWKQVAAVRSVVDFKAMNMFRLNGSFKFQKVGAGGELKVAQASDYKRSVAADTYGVITQLTRTDMINDDLNALSQIPQRIGRGAALSLNDVIWTEFQADNATYFQSATAGSGNALALSSLKTAATAYRKLKDPDGNPLAIAPKMLLVPPELEITAAELMTSALLISGNTTAAPNANVLQGRYRVVSSAYLSSATTWWLMADSADLNALDVVFLNGQQSPIIENVIPEADMLGVQIRGYMDFGVTKGEPLSTYRMATA